MKTYRSTIEKIHRISIKMLDACKENDWEKMIAEEKERQVFLDLLADNQASEFDSVSEKLLQKIISINSEIEVLSRQEMENCRLAYSEVQNKKSAISAYST